MKKLLLQAGHYQFGGGAPGETPWTKQLADIIAADMDETDEVDVTIIGDFYGKAAPPETQQDYDLFVALHYDAAIYAARGEQNSGCFADRAYNETRPLEADAFIGLWSTAYPQSTGIPLANQRRNANTNQYYAFAALTDATPGVILEHGCGSLVPSGSYPPGDDAAYLHDHIKDVAGADVAALLSYFGVATPTLPAYSPPTIQDPATIQQEALADNKQYFEQLGTPVNLSTAIMQRAILARQHGETRGPAISDEYSAANPAGNPVTRQDFTAGIAEYAPTTNSVSWVEIVIHPDAIRGAVLAGGQPQP